MNAKRRLKIFVSLLVFPLIFCGMMKAQGGMDFHARLFAITSNDGLSQGFVPSIIQDHRGFIWFATKDGLNKYDGYSFEIFRHDQEDSNSVADNFILNIFEDSRGYLWISTPGVLQVFDPLTEKFSKIDLRINGQEHGAPNKIVEDANGNLWCDGHGGQFRLNLSTRNKNAASFFQKYNVTVKYASEILAIKIIPESAQFFSDADDGLWLIQEDSIFFLSKADQSSGKITTRYSQRDFFHLPAGHFIYAHADTLLHTLVMISSTGITVYNTQTRKFQVSLNVPMADLTAWNTIASDESGNTWLSTDKGVFIYNSTFNRIRKFVPLNIDTVTWNSYSMKSTLIDRGGMVWMGTNGFGVFQYNPHVSCFNLVELPGISIINGTNDGRVFIGSHDELVSFDPVTCKTGTPVFMEKNLEQVVHNQKIYPRDFCQDKKNIFWLNYGAGRIAEYNEGTKRAKFFQLNIPGNESFVFTSKIWLDGKDEPWISVENGSVIYICHFNPASETFDAPVRFPEGRTSGMYSFISEVCTGENGNFWFGTIQGLFCFSPKTASWKIYKNIPGDKSSLSNDIIFSICPDPFRPSDYLWVGTNSGGLNRLDIAQGKFSRFTVKDGLPNNVIYGLLTDNNGNLWLSTNHGLCRFNTQTRESKNYFASDGLQGNEFNRYVFYKSDDGDLFFAGVNGMNFFYPDKLKGKEHPPSISFT
ncbi:MAG TPA: two-component regulator propeller domain-containing protein, partial [Bacteroidia bacterium]|nr:two-component regulator propeller domain-containing protein [Bacteroidia bacterium]